MVSAGASLEIASKLSNNLLSETTIRKRITDTAEDLKISFKKNTNKKTIFFFFLLCG